jgi:acetyl esterase/lipase
MTAVKCACLMSALVLAASSFAAAGTEVPSRSDEARTGFGDMHETVAAHVSPDSTIKDILRHKAFAGFGRLLLPWDDRDYDVDMRLGEIGRLLPYHSHVDPNVVVASLNRLIDDAGAGKVVFYDFYTETEKRAEPSRTNAGLILIRGRPGAPFAVIAPGGGFSYVGSLHEGFPYAAEISRHGYNAFVLKYRAGRGGTIATQDMAAAISYIIRHADTLGVGTRGYSVWGSSAGARMAAAIGSHGLARFGGDDVPKPAAVVMAYTGHSDVGTHEPATFVIVGERDGIAPPAAMESRIAALRRTGTEVEYRKVPGLGHGFGLGVGTPAEGWIGDAVRFWARQMDRPRVAR